MKNYLYGLLLLITSQLSAQNAAISEKSSIPSNQSILVFGDSLSAAYNIPREQGWVNLLQKFLIQHHFNIKVINASISGETTSGGLDRLEKQLQQHHPKIVILELGGNDGLRGFDLTTTRSNLEKMVAMSLKYSSQVLLAGIRIPPNYGRTYTRRFSAIYEDLAKNEQVVLLPFILENVATVPEYMQADGIHPNAKGQPLILETLWQYLAPMLTE